MHHPPSEMFLKVGTPILQAVAVLNPFIQKCHEVKNQINICSIAASATGHKGLLLLCRGLPLVMSIYFRQQLQNQL